MKSRVISVTSNVIGKKDVWELITNIDQWSEWDFNIEYSECIKNKTGQVSLFKVKHRIFFITGRGIVEEFRPYERFTLRIGLAGARLYRKYIMEDTKEGLKVTIVTSVSGFLAWLWNFLVVKRILRDTPEDLIIIVEQAKKTDMRNTLLFKTKFRKIIDAFWLREDILETIPNCQCEYLDNSFKLLSVSSETLFSENELKPVFELYKMEFSIVEQNISRVRLHTIS